MARASIDLIQAIRAAARNIDKSENYQWGHMGSCNCGFLAQEVTKLTKEEIHKRAMGRHGDWNEQLNDYCPTSGLLMDDLISDLLAFGFDASDLQHLERLSSPRILQSISLQERNLSHNIKSHVVKYMNSWANLLEDELISAIKITDYSNQEATV